MKQIKMKQIKMKQIKTNIHELCLKRCKDKLYNILIS